MQTLILISIWLLCGILSCILYKVFVPEHFENKEPNWQRTCFFVYFLCGPITLLMGIVEMLIQDSPSKSIE